MGKCIISESIYTTVINAEATVYSTRRQVSECSQICILVNLVKTSSPGNLTLTVEGAVDTGTWITMDFTDGTGLGTSEVYTANADDVIWLPAGCAIPPFIRVTLDSAATTDATNYWTPKIWLVGYQS